MIEEASVIIPIAGKAGSGKDTAAKMLKGKLENDGLRVVIISFADYIKFGCTAYLGWDGNKNDYGRHLLQRVGTDDIRNKYPDFWVDCVCKWIDRALSPHYDIFIIPDARFENEIFYMQKFAFDKAAIVVPTKVERQNHVSNLGEQQQQHISENALDDYDFEYTIKSKDGLGKLEVAVDYFYDYLKVWYLC